MKVFGSMVIRGAAVLLAVAAAFKLRGMMFGPGTVLSGQERNSQLLLICGEFSLFFWLMIRPHRHSSFWIVATVFSCFAVIAGSKGLSGATSCGCFGDAVVSPWVIFVVDMAVATVGLTFAISGRRRRTSDEPRTFGRTRSAPLGVRCAHAVGVGVCVIVGTFATEVVNSPTPANVVILEHNEWKGKEWPLSAELGNEVSSMLHEGRWYVLIGRLGCAVCERIIPNVAGSAASGGVRNVLIVELPATYASAKYGAHPLVAVPGVQSVKLPGDRKWVCRAPLLIVLEKGKVAAVEDDAERFLETIRASG